MSGTVQNWVWSAAQHIKVVSQTPDLDAELLMANVLRKPREWLFTHPDFQCTLWHVNRFSSLVKRRLQHEPIAYLLGHKEFFGLDFLVDRSVLIPRPETEGLVEHSLFFLNTHTHPRVIDIGVGCGTIAVSIKKNCPQAKVCGTDTSRQAVAMARRNARLLKVQLDLKVGSLFSPFAEKKFDCLVSNPPYLTRRQLKNPELRCEPSTALFGGVQGVEVYKKIMRTAPAHLNPKAGLFLEIDPEQVSIITQLAHTVWPQAGIQVYPDMSHQSRVLAIYT